MMYSALVEKAHECAMACGGVSSVRRYRTAIAVTFAWCDIESLRRAFDLFITWLKRQCPGAVWVSFPDVRNMSVLYPAEHPHLHVFLYGVEVER